MKESYFSIENIKNKKIIWRRFFAKFLDLFFCYLFFLFFLFIIILYLNLKTDNSFEIEIYIYSYIKFLFLFYLGTFIIYEIFSMYFFGNTIGKKIFGIYILKNDKKLGFLDNIKRTFCSIIFGIGIIIPFLKFKDYDEEYKVFYKEKIHFLRKIFALFSLLSFIYICLVLIITLYSFNKDNTIFKNEELGFEIKYNSMIFNFYLEEEDQYTKKFTLKFGERIIADIQVDHNLEEKYLNNLSLDNYLNMLAESYKENGVDAKLLKGKKSIIYGIKWEKYYTEMKTLGYDILIKTYFIKKGKKLYQINIYEEKNKEQNEKIFDKIIKDFKFL